MIVIGVLILFEVENFNDFVDFIGVMSLEVVRGMFFVFDFEIY